MKNLWCSDDIWVFEKIKVLTLWKTWIKVRTTFCGTLVLFWYLVLVLITGSGFEEGCSVEHQNHQLFSLLTVSYEIWSSNLFSNMFWMSGIIIEVLVLGSLFIFSAFMICRFLKVLLNIGGMHYLLNSGMKSKITFLKSLCRYFSFSFGMFLKYATYKYTHFFFFFLTISVLWSHLHRFQVMGHLFKKKGCTSTSSLSY